jgi:predicted SnoaL-like aldol condensation-catalyzing enzyme
VQPGSASVRLPDVNAIHAGLTDPLPNSYDPRQRADLSPNEVTLLRFMDEVLHGDEPWLIDELLVEEYVQHTPGIGQGREGLRRYLAEVALKRPGRHQWRPIQMFACGDIVVLHKLLATTIIVDIVRFDPDGRMAEHWDVVQRLPEPDYDPMRRSTEDLGRFASLFAIEPASDDV